MLEACCQVGHGPTDHEQDDQRPEPGLVVLEKDDDWTPLQLRYHKLS